MPLTLASPDTHSIDRQALTSALQTSWKLADLESKGSALSYLNHVVIHTIPAKRFIEVADPWQLTLASKLLPAVEFSAQVRKTYDGPTKFWVTLPKGSDKTSLIGRMINWAMAYSRSHLTIYSCAKDREQAALLFDSMRVEADLNPWLGNHLHFKTNKVVGNNSSVLHVLAADEKGTAGIRGDLLLMDELSQWDNQAFYEQLMAGVGKRVDQNKKSRCVVIIITNAGFKFSWQWEKLQEAKKNQYPNGSWWVYESPIGQKLASWMSEETINEARKFIPESLGRQLFDNEWLDPGEGCGLVTRGQARVCADLGAAMGLRLQERGVEGKQYIGSIDYAPVKDRTVLLIGHKEEGKVILDNMQVLQGSKQNHVSIKEVTKWIDWAIKNFSLSQLVIDPYQMEQVIQEYQRKVPIEVFEARGGKANYEACVCMRSLIVNKQLAWYPGCGDIFVPGVGVHSLVDELAELVIKTMSYGYRFDHEHNKHDDRVVAIAQLALQLLQVVPKKTLWFPRESESLWF